MSRFPFGSHRRRSGGGFVLLLAVTSPAAAQTLHRGAYVATSRSCQAARDSDIVVSNGHTASPSRLNCREKSRTSIGGYYPIFNQLCTGAAAEGVKIDLHVSDPEHIALQRPGFEQVAYRYCPVRQDLGR